MYYEKLTTQEKALVESQVTNNQKSLVVAYLLLFFAGDFGLHRYYLTGKYEGPALIQLILGISGWLTVWIAIGFIPLMIVYIWKVVDLFLLPDMAKVEADNVKEEFAKDMANTRTTLDED